MDDYYAGQDRWIATEDSRARDVINLLNFLMDLDVIKRGYMFNVPIRSFVDRQWKGL